ncbi:MAG: hypothetical protein ACYTHN_24440, partial [Planctomycetota bacterium]
FLALTAGCFLNPSRGLESKLEEMEKRLARIEETLDTIHNYSHPEIREIEIQIKNLKMKRDLIQETGRREVMTVKGIDEMLKKLEARLAKLKK